HAADPRAIPRPVSSDCHAHPANAAMTADDVIAHSKALHATFGEMNAAVESIIAEGNTCAARVVGRGVHEGPWRGIAPTGKRFEFRGMTFWRIRDGRIAERWAE